MQNVAVYTITDRRTTAVATEGKDVEKETQVMKTLTYKAYKTGQQLMDWLIDSNRQEKQMQTITTTTIHTYSTIQTKHALKENKEKCGKTQ